MKRVLKKRPCKHLCFNVSLPESVPYRKTVEEEISEDGKWGFKSLALLLYIRRYEMFLGKTEVEYQKCL